MMNRLDFLLRKTLFGFSIFIFMNETRLKDHSIKTFFSQTLYLQAMDERPAEDRPKPDTGKQAEIAFKLYDKDRDGYITKSEMEKLSKTLTKEQIDKVFTRFDADGDGRLSYAEFRKMMNK